MCLRQSGLGALGYACATVRVTLDAVLYGPPSSHSPAAFGVRASPGVFQIGHVRLRYNRDMPEESVRDQIKHVVDAMPADVTFEEAIERIVFLAKIDIGLAELDAGLGVPHEDVKRRLGM